MLEKLDAERKLIKLGTSEVMMTPNNTDNIRLDELNLELDKLEVPEVQNQEPPKMVDDVVPGDEIKPSSVSQKTDGVIDDFDLAKGFLMQADGMEAEAKNLREQAYDLIPKRKLNAMLKKENAAA